MMIMYIQVNVLHPEMPDPNDQLSQITQTEMQFSLDEKTFINKDIIRYIESQVNKNFPESAEYTISNLVIRP